MPYKDPAARRENAKRCYARRKADDPDWVERKTKKAAEYYQKQRLENEGYIQKRREIYKRWYDQHGKENARTRKGYIPWEEYLKDVTEKRQGRARYMRQWSLTESGQRSRVARNIKRRCGLTIDQYDSTYDAQKGNCWICGIHRERYSRDRLFVEHSH